MSQFWVVGKNANNEFEAEINDNVIEYGYNIHATRRLVMSKWTHKLKNIINITNGDGFNIITTATQQDEYAVFGFIKQCQNLLPHAINSFYIIPSSIILICLDYFGNNYNKYWSIGSNDYGQCGVGHLNGINMVEPINGMQNIEKICSGNCGYTALWITNNGEIYANGANDCSQIIENNSEYQKITTPILLDLFKQKGLKCVDAAASEDYNIIVYNDGSVWSAGSDCDGELGHECNDVVTFTQIEALKDHKIIHVSLGMNFSLFLDEMGSVWSCGSDYHGALGNDDEDSLPPTKIKIFEENNIKIIAIICGTYHCIALSENNCVYCWGGNVHGQCGLGEISKHIDKVKIPTCIEMLSTKNIKCIKSGRYHCGVITKDNNVYLWGSNDFNQCCSENKMDEKIFSPNYINQYVSKIAKCTKIINVILASDTTMVVVK